MFTLKYVLLTFVKKCIESNIHDFMDQIRQDAKIFFFFFFFWGGGYLIAQLELTCISDIYLVILWWQPHCPSGVADFCIGDSCRNKK